MEQSWGSVEEVLKDFALMLMNTGFGKHSNFNSIDCFRVNVLKFNQICFLG